ncbi:uncharacterized protein LOC125452268 [Stegostoma tigrinum]|uniref:uncharacterized protein LOC125452268 n=1 Tax=Stegostoma tigrinum TaxID=3053191 RepID=UPI0028700CD9|nr:uncharacterized protein LOC125452268 [Stegostoma tigrinum]XP_059501407.1 uncharacterized protein LOC125452268 [Stegostoma tigrinum]
MSKLAKDSTMLTVDAHMKNKKEDVLLHNKLDHLYRGHRIVLSTLQQESTNVTEELQNILSQKTILQKCKLDDLITQLRTFKKGGKTEITSDGDTTTSGVNSLFFGRAKTAPSTTVSNLQSGQRRASLLNTWAGLDGRTSPNSSLQDELDGKFSTNQYMKKMPHMSSSINNVSSRPPGFRRSKSIVSLGRNTGDGGNGQCLTRKELRRLASMENICQKVLERQKLDRLQEREQFKKFLDEKMKEKVNDFIKTLDKNLK